MKIIATIIYALFGITGTRRLVCGGVGFLMLAVFTMGAINGCDTPPKKPDAAPTTKGSSPIPAAITEARTKALEAIKAAEEKLAALESRAATAAAQIESARIANTNQPPSPATTIVDKETGMALSNLPSPDAKAALESEKRRTAMLAGQVDEAKKLYAAAQTETERLKSEATAKKSEAAAAVIAATAAQDALVAADKKWAAELKANEAANQAKLDNANKRADEAEEKAKNERHNLIFRSLLGLGLACIAGAIAMAVLTQGAMLSKSLMLAGGGALCIGVAQIVSHPWFDRIFGGCIALSVIGSGAYLFFECQDAVRKRLTDKTVEVLDRVKNKSAVLTVGEDGKESNLALELSRKFGDDEKAVVKRLRIVNASKAARAGL